MAITLKDVRHIASLAHLEFSDEEAERFTRQLGAILDYVAELDRLDTSAIEPTSHVSTTARALRDDRARPSPPHDEALANAPDADDRFFRVPKVIG